MWLNPAHVPHNSDWPTHPVESPPPTQISHTTKFLDNPDFTKPIIIVSCSKQQSQWRPSELPTVDETRKFLLLELRKTIVEFLGLARWKLRTWDLGSAEKELD